MTHRFLLLVLACLTVLPSCKKKAPGITVVSETEAQRSEAVKAAFVEGAATGGKRIEKGQPGFTEVDTFLSKFGTAATKKDLATYRTCLSMDAMVRNLEAKGMITFKNDRERDAFMKGAEGSMGSSMASMGFENHTLARLEEIAPNQVMAFTRAFNDDMEMVVKMRWWLVKEEGTWKIYDFEELSQGVRASTMMGAMVGGMKGKEKAWVPPMLEMSKKMQTLSGDNMLETLASLRDLSEKVLKNSPPPEVEAFARQMLVSGMMANGDAAEALAEVEQLEKLPNISPGIHFLKGCALTAIQKPVEARAAFERYADLLGWDSDAHEMMADAYLAEGNKKDALDHALKGLADQKEATGCLATAAVAAGADRIGELKPHFDAISDPEGAYEAVIDHALESDEEDTAKAVLGLLKEKLPDSDLVEAYEEVFAGGGDGESE